MSSMVETCCLAAGVRVIHQRAALLVALLRWLFSRALPAVPGLCDLGQSRNHGTHRRSGGQVVKDGLRVSTYGEVVAGEEEEEEEEEMGHCAVCLGQLRGSDPVRLPRNCRHLYHLRCLDRWIDQQQQHQESPCCCCPLCRAPLLHTPRAPPEVEEQHQPTWAVQQLLFLFGDDLLPHHPLL